MKLKTFSALGVCYFAFWMLCLYFGVPYSHERNLIFTIILWAVSEVHNWLWEVLGGTDANSSTNN